MGANEVRWADASPAHSGDPALSPAQVEAWRARGFVLVDRLYPDELTARAQREAAQVYPAPGTPEAGAIDDFGGMGAIEFPSSKSPAANELTLHPRVLGAVAQLLDLRPVDLRLTQSNLWPKYGRPPGGSGIYDHSDQRIHVDYPNHTLTHPPEWQRPEAVEIIVYLSDVADCGGATAVVPRTGDHDPAYSWPIVSTPGVGGIEWINDREAAEAHMRTLDPAVADWRQRELYDREEFARFRVGTVLFYRHDTWHRGTPLEPGAMRLAMNLTFRRREAEWMSVVQTGWAWAMYRRSAVMERLIAQASPEQRCVLGFPEPGNTYWTPETVAAVGARYGAWGIDMSPYREALERPGSKFPTSADGG
jgi:hypothetical protein